MSLNDFLKQNQINGMYPFHMPGHKRNREFLGLDVLDIDITEINGADNLHNPTGHIKNIQSGLAELYNSEESIISVNGSTSCIIAAILSTCCAGDKVLVARNSHKSVFSGLILSGASPVYIYPKVDSNGLCMGIDPAEVGQALEKDSSIKTVIITSPTYEGVCSDIGKISKIVHDSSAVLIVDEAHGAHFGFHEFFPNSSVNLGADIVIHSLHKTMPVLTQASVLHINGRRVNRNALKSAMSMVQTSSPSYILMSAVETFVENFRINSKIYFENYVDLLYSVRKKLSLAKSVKLSEPETIYDRGKLLFCCDSKTSGLNGNELECILRNEFRIEVEMSNTKHLLAMTSVCDSREGFDRLSNAIQAIDRRYTGSITKGSIVRDNTYSDANTDNMHDYNFDNNFFTPSDHTQFMIPQKAFQHCLKNTPSEIDYKLTAGMISAGFVIPYPPGVPLLIPGELITPFTTDIIDHYIKNGLSILGNFYNKLQVFTDISE